MVDRTLKGGLDQQCHEVRLPAKPCGALELRTGGRLPNLQKSGDAWSSMTVLVGPNAVYSYARSKPVSDDMRRGGRHTCIRSGVLHPRSLRQCSGCGCSLGRVSTLGARGQGCCILAEASPHRPIQSWLCRLPGAARSHSLTDLCVAYRHEFAEDLHWRSQRLVQPSSVSPCDSLQHIASMLVGPRRALVHTAMPHCVEHASSWMAGAASCGQFGLQMSDDLAGCTQGCHASAWLGDCAKQRARDSIDSSVLGLRMRTLFQGTSKAVFERIVRSCVCVCV